MNSWVYVFSKFTPEALLFEVLAILALMAAYSAFWILKKRRYGIIEESMPAGPVKFYLNELISHAEQLKFQLFGVLSDDEVGQGPKVTAALSGEMAAKLNLLEEKIGEQNKLLQTLAEGGKIVGQGAASAPGAALSKEELAEREKASSAYQARIKELESKLSEYSIIEDDLANLKRIQLENKELRALLDQAGINPANFSGATAQAAPAAPAAPEMRPSGGSGGGEDNLVAEFEKMLSG